jgi:hypothetical protein
MPASVSSASAIRSFDSAESTSVSGRAVWIAIPGGTIPV